MHKLLAIIHAVKQRPLIDWSPLLQRCLLVSVGILLFLLLNRYVLTAPGQALNGYKTSSDRLTQALKTQQSVIQQVQSRQHAPAKRSTVLSRVMALDLANFMSQIARLSHQNHLEMQAIQPMTIKKVQLNHAAFTIQPFQISAVGSSYADFLRFALSLSALPALALISDFRIVRLTTANNLPLLSLWLVIDLYVQVPA